MISSIQLDVRPSRWLAACLSLLHLAALVAAIVSLSSWILLWVSIGIALSGGVIVAGVLQRLPGAICRLELGNDGSARWRELDGTWHAAKLGIDGYVSPWLVILALEYGAAGFFQARRWVVLGPDASDPEALRRLRVWLKSKRALASRSNNHAER